MASDAFLSWANRTVLRPGRENSYTSTTELVLVLILAGARSPVSGTHALVRRLSLPVSRKAVLSLPKVEPDL
jgi:hypothetical protein